MKKESTPTPKPKGTKKESTPTSKPKGTNKQNTSSDKPTDAKKDSLTAPKGTTKGNTSSDKPTDTKKDSLTTPKRTSTSKPTGNDSSTHTFTLQDDDTVVLNIGGTRFETHMQTLRKWPESRLAKTIRKDAENYREKTDEYFYDRDPAMFRCIIDFYRNDILHFPHDICGPVIHHELSYWEIEEEHVAPCCWEFFKSRSEDQATVELLCKSLEPEVESRLGPRKRRLTVTAAGTWTFLEDPASSNGAMVRRWWVNATEGRGFVRGAGDVERKGEREGERERGRERETLIVACMFIWAMFGVPAPIG